MFVTHSRLPMASSSPRNLSVLQVSSQCELSTSWITEVRSVPFKLSFTFSSFKGYRRWTAQGRQSWIMFAFANYAPWGPLQRNTPQGALFSLWFSIHRGPNTCMGHLSWPLSVSAPRYSYSSLLQFLLYFNITWYVYFQNKYIAIQ